MVGDETCDTGIDSSCKECIKSIDPFLDASILTIKSLSASSAVFQVASTVSKLTSFSPSLFT